ncbi:hypothetical protein BN12_530031 [Nostocoides japonicum T1-X7]|uniref:Uncharacterized protein n=1 Tax=Nostocoides japonicum T1-X7 TaxID=1194083 RepID=A0A077M3U7_9MICO|nr:hypothetical protein BN12_530031 [Tetrasphaera japonica T1-X7]
MCLHLVSHFDAYARLKHEIFNCIVPCLSARHKGEPRTCTVGGPGGLNSYEKTSRRVGTYPARIAIDDRVLHIHQVPYVIPAIGIGLPTRLPAVALGQPGVKGSGSTKRTGGKGRVVDTDLL